MRHYGTFETESMYIIAASGTVRASSAGTSALSRIYWEMHAHAVYR